MRVVFLGKHKRSAARALDWLVGAGADVVGVVAPQPDSLTREPQRLDLVAARHGLPLASESQLYDRPPENVDVVVSFLFWKLIREPLLSLGRIGCLNFHPAPLPDSRGLGGLNVAILEGREQWGVSCHFVDESFDTGDLIEVERFPIDDQAETAFSLDLKTQERLLGLFKRVMQQALDGDELPRTQQGEGRYVTREEFEALRRVRPGDDLPRKIRAFWYPPYAGAGVDVDGQDLTVVDEPLLARIAEAYRDAGHIP
jgi:methionyl-tRNA formyltransferase